MIGQTVSVYRIPKKDCSAGDVRVMLIMSMIRLGKGSLRQGPADRRKEF